MSPSRHSVSFLRRLPICFAALLMLAGGASAAVSKAPTNLVPKPDASLDPAAVVRIQLAALAHVDEPVHDAGFNIVFAFASPGNQVETGPVKHFAQMIRNSYGDLLNHRSATLDPIKLEGDMAFQAVNVIDRAGAAHRYVFLLSKQPDGACTGCWLTDSVFVDPRQEKKGEEI